MSVRPVVLLLVTLLTASTSPGQAGTATPSVVVLGASSSQAARLALALERFRAAGLDLPGLQVEFPSDRGGCRGHMGVHRRHHGVAHIAICSDDEFVYEHELAHAWEAAHVSEELRRSFMELRGHPTWNDRAYPWRERGVEGAAFVVQQGVAGLPLPPSLSEEQVNRLAAYELLTGLPAPRLVEWMGGREVPCAERPTPLAGGLPDAGGAVCDR